jgi:hypothetical protein
MEQMQAKLITYEDAVEQNGQNPDEVERSWMLHDLKGSTEIQGEIRNAVFTKLATIRAQKVQAPGMPTAEQLTGGGLPGQGGMPGNPVPSPGFGLPMQPTPAGAITGVGPLGAGLGRGNPPGTPVSPNIPQAAQSLPGQ